jgi:hypothetical protein
MSISHLGKLRRDQPLDGQFVRGPLIRIGRAKHLQRLPLTTIKDEIDVGVQRATRRAGRSPPAYDSRSPEVGEAVPHDYCRPQL